MVSNLIGESNRLTMWQTVNARLRASKAELEEIGEDTENVATSTSKLRDQVKGLTGGFDIMKDENTFKDTYEILLGIGKVWKDMSDIDQAALLELLAGKRQSNALAAVLTNIDTLEKAYASAENSAGSAEAEQERYMQGIAYSMGQFRSSIEELNHTILDSSIIKFFVDLGTTGVKVIDTLAQKFSLLPTIINGALLGMTAKTGKNMFAIPGSYILDRLSASAAYSNLPGTTGNVITNFLNPNVSRLTSLNSNTSEIMTAFANSGKTDISELNDLLGKPYKENLDDLTKAFNDFTAATDKSAKSAAITTVSWARFGDVGSDAASSASKLGSSLAQIATTQAGILLASFAINMLVKGINDYIHSYDNAINAMNSKLDEYNQHQDKVTSIQTQLDEIDKKIKEINNNPLAFTDKSVLPDLIAQREELEATLAVEKALAQIKLDEAMEEAQKALSPLTGVKFHNAQDLTALREGYTNKNDYFAKHNFGTEQKQNDLAGTITIALDKEIDYAKSLQKEIENTKKKINELNEAEGDHSAEIVKLGEDQKRYENALKSSQKTIIGWRNDFSKAYSVALQQAKIGYDGLSNEEEELSKTILEVGKKSNDFILSMDKEKVAAESVAQALSKVGMTSVNTKDDMTAIKTSVDAVTQSFSDLYSLISSQKAGTNISLDADQLEKYGGMLEYVNGVYQLNSEAVEKNALQKAKNTSEEIKHQKALEQAQYLENAKDIETYTKALAEGQKLKKDGLDVDQKYIDQLKAANEQILSNCKAYDYQIQQLEGVQSAYEKWLSTGTIDVDSSMYANVTSALDQIDERMKDGKFGKQFFANLELVLPEDIDVNDKENVKKYLAQIKKFFDKENGIDTFLKTAKTAGLMDIDENGTYFVKEGKTIDDFMDHLVDGMHFSETVIRAIFDELEQAYGWTSDWVNEATQTLGDEVIEAKANLDKLNAEYEALNKKPELSLTEKEVARLKELSGDNGLINKAKKKYEELNGVYHDQINGVLSGKDTYDKLNLLKRYSSANKSESGYTAVELEKEILNSFDEDYLIKVRADPQLLEEEIQRLKDKLQEELNLSPLDVSIMLNDIEPQLQQLKEEFENSSDPQERDALRTKIQQLEDIVKILNELNITSEIDTNGNRHETESSKTISDQVTDIQTILEQIRDKIPGETNHDSKDHRTGKKGQTGDYIDWVGLGDVDLNPASMWKKSVKTSPVAHQLPVTTFKTDIDASGTKEATEGIQNYGDAVKDTGEKAKDTTQKISTLNDNIKQTPTNLTLQTNFSSTARDISSLNRGLQDYLNKYTSGVNSGAFSPSSTKPTPYVFTGETEAIGNAFATGTDVVGEQGRELVVDPHRGIWYTVGDAGTEMIDLPKDAIIYSHNQTEALLKSGVTSRGKSTGKSFASGNAYAGKGTEGTDNSFTSSGNSWNKNDIDKSAKQAEKSAEKVADSAKETEEKAEQVYDWVERALDYSSRQVEQIRDIVDDETLSYQERLSFAESLIELDKEHIDALEQARDIRSQEYSEAVQKMQEGLTPELFDEIQANIEHGNLDLEKYKTNFTELFGEDGEKKYQLVVDTVEAYDNITELSDKLLETEKQLREDTMKPYELRLNVIKSEMEELNSVADELQHNLDMKDILGIAVTEGDYTRQIDNAKDKLENLEEQLDVLQEKADATEYGSDEWYQVQQEIASINKEMMDLNRSIAEWNYQIKRLPIERISKHLRMLANIKTDIENSAFSELTYGSEVTEKVLQETSSILSKEKDLYLEQAQLVRNLRNEMEYGSEKWHDLDDELQGIEDKIKDIVNQIKEMAKQILQLPIDAIEKQNAQLQKMADYLQKDQDRYDAILAAVNEVYDTERERIEQERDYLNEQLQDEIDKYQDVLDLLNEQNEARQVRIDLENAQYNLDKARQQRNIQVVRNGRIEYDSDMSAVRDAEQGLSDAEYSKRQYDLQQSIDKLSKQQEENNDKAEEALKALEEGQKPWSEIADQHQKIANASQALALFGEGWEDKITSGDDQQMREYFDGLYQDNQAEIEANHKQTEQNEEVIGVLTAIEDALDSGNITAERAEELRASLQTAVDSNVLSNDTLKKFYLDLYGADSTRGLNDNVEAAVRQIYTDYGKQIEQASVKYAEAEQLQQVLNEFTEAEDNEAKIAKENSETLKKIEQNTAKSSSRRRSNRDDNDDDDENDPGEFSKNPTRYGAHTSKNPYSGTLTGDEVESRRATDDNTEAVENLTKAVDEWSTDYQEAHGATGPARELEPHSDGLKYGPVGMMSSSDKFKMLQKLSLTKLDPDEVPTLLHRGEAVLNQNQINTVLENMATLSRQSLAPVPVSNSRSSTTQINMTFGDLNLPNVHDANSFAESIKMNFELAMNQQFSKR